jgi:peptidoglycan/LPS O-acetylase OafA/YrhL
MSTSPLPSGNPRVIQRIPELDGIRGLAILLVLVCHYVAYPVPNAPHGSWQAYFLDLFRLTWSGVDLFFVLSGFLIGGILLDAKDSKRYYRTFYFRRICRIFPLYFLSVALFIAGLHLVRTVSSGPLKDLFNRGIPLWSYLFFLQNFSMTHRQTFGAGWMAMTWSLAVEEQFYLLLPLLVRRLNRRGIAWVALAAIACAPLYRIILTVSGDAYLGPYTLLPCRADALGFGVLAALECRSGGGRDWLLSHRKHLYLALGLLGCGIALLAHYEQFLYNIGLTWIAAFYAVLLLLTVVKPGRIETTCFRNPVLIKAGTISYAVYIFHQGINDLLHFAVLGRAPSIVDWPSLFVTLLSLAAVMFLAVLSWELIEKPLIQRAHAALRY